MTHEVYVVERVNVIIVILGSVTPRVLDSLFYKGSQTYRPVRNSRDICIWEHHANPLNLLRERSF